MEYRLAKTEDVERIFELICDAIKEMESRGIFQWDAIYPTREDFYEDIEDEALYIAYEEDAIVAIYVISAKSDEAYQNATWKYPDETAYILHRFCVAPGYQNQGMGKKILTNIEEQVRSMGYESVRLDVFTGNPFALKLYDKSGYETRGYADWRKGRFALMEKKL